jgi:hypothetical protein
LIAPVFFYKYPPAGIAIVKYFFNFCRKKAMKKYIIFITAVFLFSLNALHAQDRTLKQVMELKMPKNTGDELCGTRGAGVCWNPLTQKYYAAFAGNTGFPMGVFTAAGKIISGDTVATMEDIRGIWYDAAINKIMANGYNDIGWINYELDKAGMPTHYYYKYLGMNQPNMQSVGAYDNKMKKVLFLDGSRVMLYEGTSMAAAVKDSVQIHWGRKKAEGAGDNEGELKVNEDYNGNVVATNIKDAEFGFLNITSKQIELYDYKGGFLQQTLKLPDTAPVEALFNFANSNGIYWLFDIANRKWIGYK